MKNKTIIYMVIIIITLMFISSCKHMWKSYDDAVINYEQYQEIYTTTKKINTDLCSMRQLPEKDPMFAQFRKTIH